MGFTTISGTMGGGKSYYAAELALQAWKEGAIVHSNMDFDEAELKRLGFLHLHIRLPANPTEWIEVIKGGEEGKENLLIVDESAMIFHAWDIQEQKKRDRDLFDTLVMSRKLGLDCYFISQHADNISSPLRRISQYDLRCVATAKVPIIGPTIKRLKGDFLRIIRQPETRKEISRTYHRFDPNVGRIYITEAVRGAASRVQREVTRTVPQTAKTPFWLKLTTVILLCAMIGGAISTKHTWDKMATATTSKPAPQETKGKQAPQKNLADTFGAAITPSSGPSVALPPALHPAGPASGHVMRWIEWEPSNERIVTSVYRSGVDLVIYTLGGERWTLGRPVAGQMIQEIIPFNGAYFVRTDTQTVYYLRPRTYEERRAYDEYIVRRAAENQSRDTPWNTQLTQPRL